MCELHLSQAVHRASLPHLSREKRSSVSRTFLGSTAAIFRCLFTGFLTFPSSLLLLPPLLVLFCFLRRLLCLVCRAALPLGFRLSLELPGPDIHLGSLAEAALHLSF